MVASGLYRSDQRGAAGARWFPKRREYLEEQHTENSSPWTQKDRSVLISVFGRC